MSELSNHETRPTDPVVSTEWLVEHLRQNDLVILDATVVMSPPQVDGDYRGKSGQERWLSGHIPGSHHADLISALSDQTAAYKFAVPEPTALAHSLERLGVSNASLVVIYDSDGGLWAARLWWMLRWIGIDGYILDGGWQAWLTEGREIEQGDAPVPQPGHIQPAPRDGFWYSLQQVEDVVGGRRSATLINALSPDSFAGRVPTRYARRGHIPTSLNLPARELTRSDGRFRPLTELASTFASTIGSGPHPLILYCGGGISAAAVALTLIRLGDSDIGIYDGSIEEWAAQPHLPLIVERNG
jgi:thiosulfate/3-mercaptopyruvate sulfurtransferase